MDRAYKQGIFRFRVVTPNPSLNRARSDLPPSGLISFWPFGVLPSGAG